MPWRSRLQRHGVEPGDRVAMYLQNIPQVLITVLAVWKCGAVVVPCNPMLRERELVKILSDSGSRVLLCQEDLYAEVARAALPSTAVQHTITTSALDFLDPGLPVPPILARATRLRSPGISDLLQLVDRHRGEVPEPTDITGEDVAFMVYTSGTTGAPKAAMNTHRNVVFATSVYERWIGLTGGGHDPRPGAAVSRDRADRARQPGAADRQPADPVLPLRCRRSVPAHRGPSGDVHRLGGDGVHRAPQQRDDGPLRPLVADQGLYRGRADAARRPRGLASPHGGADPPDVWVDGSDLADPHDARTAASRPSSRGRA